MSDKIKSRVIFFCPIKYLLKGTTISLQQNFLQPITSRLALNIALGTLLIIYGVDRQD